MKRIQKWSALFMAVTLLFTLAAPAALAAESTVTIKTAEDLAELSRNCTLDTWSQGKTVILENDLDLHGVDFTPIPTFSGTFQGNGHTISGLTLTGSGNVRGLFRYIQNGATVQDLTVTSTIPPNGHQDDLGLLAGSNAGRLLNCIASGTVMGDYRRELHRFDIRFCSLLFRDGDLGHQADQVFGFVLGGDEVAQ